MKGQRGEGGVAWRSMRTERLGCRGGGGWGRVIHCEHNHDSMSHDTAPIITAIARRRTPAKGETRTALVALLTTSAMRTHACTRPLFFNAVAHHHPGQFVGTIQFNSQNLKLGTDAVNFRFYLLEQVP